ncbi:cell division protein ZapE [Hyphomicrobium sp.]|jgi:cell division protein ZapE|uniref:cell division protein ZapE n=1 Tax=Hyphomicrobium sp. TaxID=82 RepID=UPI00356512D3
MMATVLDGYRRRLADNEIEPDAAQAAVATRLDALDKELASYRPKNGVLSKLFGKPAAPTKGLYIWGSVGRGKTMLMDLFFEETSFEPKRRSHFHEFMADVHERIAKARHDVPGDPIPHVAEQIAKEARLLCFDEMHVTDIADAMILGRLFEALFAAGTVIVTTSNATPAGLYKDGLNRQLFLPFIAELERHLEVIELGAKKDFRLDKLFGLQLYFYPADAAAKAALDANWRRLTGNHPGKSQTIEVLGRKVPVPLASMGVARFHFRDLCDMPLGANDYLHIAHAFHTVLIDEIPLLTPERRDVARRFITLIDALYDSRICLIASAAAEPSALYPKGDGAQLFERTASRLTEMRSEAYLAGHSGGRSRH